MVPVGELIVIFRASNSRFQNFHKEFSFKYWFFSLVQAGWPSRLLKIQTILRRFLKRLMLRLCSVSAILCYIMMIQRKNLSDKRQKGVPTGPLPSGSRPGISASSNCRWSQAFHIIRYSFDQPAANFWPCNKETAQNVAQKSLCTSHNVSKGGH